MTQGMRGQTHSQFEVFSAPALSARYVRCSSLQPLVPYTPAVTVEYGDWCASVCSPGALGKVWLL